MLFKSNIIFLYNVRIIKKNIWHKHRSIFNDSCWNIKWRFKVHTQKYFSWFKGLFPSFLIHNYLSRIEEKELARKLRVPIIL